MNTTSSTPARRRTPSPALIVSIVALVVALGGTSYAALKLPKNSVGPGQIRANAVSSPKVKDGSLLARDFKKGQLPAGARGPKGERGLAGAAGTARAHATIQSAGHTDPAFLGAHPGFVKVERSPTGFPGHFCLTPGPGIPTVNSGAVASVDGAGSETDASWVNVHSSIGTVGSDAACPDGTIEVTAARLLTGDANLTNYSNQIDFSIIVP